MNTVNSFQGEFRFLSNFWPCTIVHDGLVYKSTEHAYQAAKTENFSSRILIANSNSPGKAKRAGRNVDLRRDWEAVKVKVMFELVLQKFSRHRDLRRLLLHTGSAKLIEGNHWNDTFWGVCRGKGENKLGKILMEVRDLVSNVQ
jgi:ribA/ribD-fused uncharacterized protein